MRRASGMLNCARWNNAAISGIGLTRMNRRTRIRIAGIAVGATKISDHHARSPLLNINHACQTCHKRPEAELKARVEDSQDRTFRLRNLAMDALVEFISEIKAAKTAGKTD